MTDHDEHAPEEAATGEHAHPGAKEYLAIATILTVLTAIEVAVFYIPAMHPMLVPTLLTLSAVKFALVAMFYMHLKQDHQLFTGVFVFPLLITAIVILAMVALMAYHWAFATGG